MILEAGGDIPEHVSRPFHVLLRRQTLFHLASAHTLGF